MYKGGSPSRQRLSTEGSAPPRSRGGPRHPTSAEDRGRSAADDRDGAAGGGVLKPAIGEPYIGDPQSSPFGKLSFNTNFCFWLMNVDES